MKSSKLVLIAAILACFTVNMAMADGFQTKTKKIISYRDDLRHCTLVKACHIPELLEAILEQVDPWFLLMQPNKPSYTVKVICNNLVWLITGTREEWIDFGLQYWGIVPIKIQTAIYYE